MNQLLFLLVGLTSSANADEKIIMHYDEYDGHENYWKMTPTVIICKDKTVFTEDQVRYAIKVWGEKYTNIIVRDTCNYKSEYGKIKIVDGKQLKKSEWGYTYYFYRDITINNKVVREHESALVQLDRNVNDISLLIHEIGHAYGYNHYDHKKDIMNTYYRYDSTGQYPY